MRPTGLGIKAALFFAVLLAAFLATAYSNLFFLLLTALVVLGGCAMVWSARSLRGLVIESVAVEATPAGSRAAVRVEFDAAGRDRVGMTLEFVIGDDVYALPLSLLREERVWCGRLPELTRGVYTATEVRFATAAPFALFRTVVPVAAIPPIAIYPRPLGETEESGAAGGDELGANGAGASQPAGLREFRPGDDPRRIHWKASARRGEPVLQEWDGGRGAGYEIVLDRRGGAAFEHALSMIASAAQRAREAKETLTLHTQDHVATYGAEQRPWGELLFFLAGVTALDMQAPPPPVAPPEATRLPRAEAVA